MVGLKMMTRFLAVILLWAAFCTTTLVRTRKDGRRISASSNDSVVLDDDVLELSFSLAL